MNVTINTAAALDDAAQIENVVTRLTDDMATLNQAIKDTIPAGIQTEWSETLSDNWNKYYTADIPNAMEEMKVSASNIQMAVQTTEDFSKER